MTAWPLLAAALLLLVGGGIAVAYLLAPARKEEQIGDDSSPAAASDPGPAVALPADPAPRLGRLLMRTGLQSRLHWELVRAGVMLRPSEVAALSLGAGAVGWLVGALTLKSYLLGLILALGGLWGPWLALGVRKGQRLKKLTRQLPAALTMLSSSLRSGYSLLRSLEVIAGEMDPPVRQEFRRILDETAVGYSLEQALTNMVYRTQSSDVKLMVTAMQIQAQAGGNLAEILDNTAATIRERFQLAAEISTLTAEGRMSVMILAGLPIGLALIINTVSPGYLSPLWTDPLGRMMLGAGAVMLTTGVLITKRMLNVNL